MLKGGQGGLCSKASLTLQHIFFFLLASLHRVERLIASPYKGKSFTVAPFRHLHTHFLVSVKPIQTLSWHALGTTMNSGSRWSPPLLRLNKTLSIDYTQWRKDCFDLVHQRPNVTNYARPGDNLWH